MVQKHKAWQLDDEAWLRYAYEENFRSVYDMGSELGCHATTVLRALRRYDIVIRKRTSKYRKINDKKWLKEQYEGGRSLPDIAKETGSTVGNVHSALLTLGVEIRSYSEGIKLSSPEKRRGEGSAHWKGGKFKSGYGYVFILAHGHPRSTPSNPHVQEHILVAEEKIGRYLADDEVVHHIDGVRDNNHPDNLEVMTRSEHTKIHFRYGREIAVLERKIAKLEAENKELREQLKDC